MPVERRTGSSAPRSTPYTQPTRYRPGSQSENTNPSAAQVNTTKKDWHGNHPDAIVFSSKSAQYGWLSNFHHPILLKDDEGHQYYSLEAYFQAAKYARRGDASILRKFTGQAVTPGQAKSRGGRRGEPMTEQEVKAWNSGRRVTVMKKGLQLKFQDPELREKLLGTGCKVLIENTGRDTFWGATKKGGCNVLGQLLMQVRDEIRQPEQGAHADLAAADNGV